MNDEKEKIEEFEIEEIENFADLDAASGKKRKKKKQPSFLLGILLGIVIGLAVIVGFFTFFSVRNQAVSAVESQSYYSKINLILQYLNLFYLGDLDDETIETALAKGLLSGIGDKYAEYYTEEEFNDLKEQTSGEYGGIGVSIVQTDDIRFLVYEVFEDTPAYEAGIEVGDYIVEACGEREVADLDTLVALVRGEPGTEVDIVIERDGEEIPLTLERQTLETESVYAEMLNDDIGYIEISSFATSTVTQLDSAIDELLDAGMTSLIFDVRSNSGGDYDSVVAIIDRLVPEGVIVTVKDNMGVVQTERSDATCLDIPMVVLVDQNTASAAELFTMALRDYGMADVVGVTTYGKGIVQSIFSLPDGTGMKFTTEEYYGPAGVCIHETGIEPDYVVEFSEEALADNVITIDEDTQMEKAVELLGGDWQQILDKYMTDETEE